MENFLVIFLLLLLGITLARLPDMPDDAAKALNLFVVYVSLPALILAKLPQLEFTWELFIPLLIPWLMLAISVLMVLGLCRLLNWRRQVRGVLLLLVPLGNTSFLGIPMVQTFFGPEGVPYAVVYDQFGSFLALSSYGVLMLAAQSGATKPTPTAIVRKIITFPPFIALLLALACRPFTYPAAVHQALTMIAASLVPVVMVAVGMQLTIRLDVQNRGPFAIGLLLKLVASPLVAFMICKGLDQSGLAAKVAIFEAGMPPMVMAGALAMVAGMAPELIAALVGLGILASFVTLPLLFQLLMFL